jgi:HK97 family phage prohead protease
MTVLRTFPLEDITIRSEGGGRIVEALAAVWNVEADVRDHQGEYREVLRSGLFDDHLKTGHQPTVLYNHGRDVWGQPSERFSMPLGVPLDIRNDARGLVTVTRYAPTELADEVLALINDGAIRGQSFRSEWMRSTPSTGFWRAARDGRRQLVERLAARLIEYGPTPMPIYQEAEILSVRSLHELVQALSDADRRSLAMMLLEGTPLDSPAAETVCTDEEGDQPHEPDPGPTLDSTPLDVLAAQLELRRRQLVA